VAIDPKSLLRARDGVLRFDRGFDRASL